MKKMKENKKLITDLEEIYKDFNSICETHNYNCMICPLCFSHNSYSNYYLCDIVGELILMMNEFYKEGDVIEKNND